MKDYKKFLRGDFNFYWSGIQLFWVSRRKRVAQMHDWWCCWLWTPAGAHVIRTALAFLQWHIKAPSRAANWNFNANSRNRSHRQRLEIHTLETHTCSWPENSSTSTKFYRMCKMIFEKKNVVLFLYSSLSVQKIPACNFYEKKSDWLCNRLRIRV